MPTSSISGLASGLDTATIIDQLMQLEAMSQNRLRSQQSAQKTVLAALQALNTDTSLLAGKAETLAKPETWQTLKATSSNGDITATAGASAAASSFSVTIDKLAIAHRFALTESHGLDDVVVPGGASPTYVKITTTDASTGNPVVHDIATGTGSLKDVIAGINAATKDTGVTATAVKVEDGTYRLLVQSSKTGKGSAFTLTQTDGTALMGGEDATTRSVGADAQVSVGGITATSSTNTFSELVPGVTLTLKASATIGATSTITVAQDSSGVKASVKGLVDQLNALLTKIDGQTAGKTGTTSAGALAGDGTARSLRSALLDTVFGSGTTSMASLGIQTDRYGKLVLDDAKFDTAYTADPAAVAKQFTKGATTAENGWAARLQAAAKTFSDSTTGILSSAITGRQSTIDRLGDDIDAWDDRLALRRESLTRQYTALETALSSLQSQGNWLAGQLASLPTSSSS